MICRRYLLGILSLGVGVGMLAGRLIPSVFLVFMCGIALIVVGIALLTH